MNQSKTLQKFIPEINKICGSKTELSIKDVKSIWILVFGYKITKEDIFQKFGNNRFILKSELIKEIERLMPFQDKGKK